MAGEYPELEPHIECWQRMLAAQPERFRSSYDAQMDTFYLALGTPRPAWSHELEEGIVLRLDFDTNGLVGIEVQDFQSSFLKQHPAIAESWRATSNLGFVSSSLPWDHMGKQEAIQQLALAITHTARDLYAAERLPAAKV